MGKEKARKREKPKKLGRESTPKDWKLEAEMKLFASEEKLQEVQDEIEEGKHSVNTFTGTVTTHWFNGTLPKGVSARVKETEEIVDGKKVEKFFWTIKLDPANDTPAKFLKNKQECEIEVASFQEAYAALMHELGRLNFPTFLKEDLVVKKTRISYMFEKGPYRHLRFDFDAIFKVTLRGETKSFEKTPMRFLETEDMRNRTAAEKQAYMLNCLSDFDLQPEEELSKLSTRKIFDALYLMDTLRSAKETNS